MGKLVDTEAAVSELGLEMSDFLEICGELKIFIDTTLPMIENAIQEKDTQAQKEYAHSLKGALKNLRFIEGGRLAEEIENIASGESSGNVEELFPVLKKVLQDSMAELGL